jgi:hypothetical protein
MPQVVIRDETALSSRRPSLTFFLRHFYHLLTSDKTSILFRSGLVHLRRVRVLTLSLTCAVYSSLKDSFKSMSNSELVTKAWFHSYSVFLIKIILYLFFIDLNCYTRSKASNSCSVTPWTRVQILLETWMFSHLSCCCSLLCTGPIPSLSSSPKCR